MSRRKNPKKEPVEKPGEPKQVVSPMGKLLVAVDLANLYCQLKSVYADNGRVGQIGGDYSKLRSFLLSSEDEGTMMCFAPITNPGEDRDSYLRTHNLHNMLRYYGYMVYTTERRNGKADVDVQLAVKVMELLSRSDYDGFILVSADGDFEPLLTSVRESGVHTSVASVEQYMSVKLKMNSDRIIDLYQWATMSPADDNRKVKLNEIQEAVARSLEEVSSTVYEIGKIYDDKARRRLALISMASAMGKLMNTYGAAKMMIHRGIVGSLKDCVDAIGADGLDRDDIGFVSSVMETLRSGEPSVGMNGDIRSRFASRRMADDA